MNTGQRPAKIGRISIVFDERISREKNTALTRIVNLMRTFAEIKMLKGSISEDELVAELDRHPPDLLLLPYYRYLSWSKIEGFFGMTRANGPTVAGYHMAGTTLNDLVGTSVDYLRAIMLDFGSMSPADAASLVRSLVIDKTRSGIQPLIEDNTTIYCERWYDQQGPGMKIDSVLSLEEINRNPTWLAQSSEIRIAISAFWSMIYEHGPGKTDFRAKQQPVVSSSPRAVFQISVGTRCVAMRLFYAMPSWTPKEIVRLFWPDPQAPQTSAPQLLLRFMNLVRVHQFIDTNEVEIVALLFPKSERAGNAEDRLRSFWIEPLQSNLISENAMEMPGSPNEPRLRPLPGATVNEARAREMTEDTTRERRQIAELQQQIWNLKRELREREEKINELKSGGVGTAQPPAPPDAESLIDAFHDRFLDANEQIREFEEKIAHIERQGIGAATNEIQNLRLRITALARREESWILRIGEILKSYRKSRPA